jgi:hypothetical protein
MRRVLQDERGMALAVAIFALVVAGALIGGVFFAGTQEQRAGANSVRVQQSFAAAEQGLNEVVRSWNTPLYNTLAPGDTFVFAPTPTADGTGSYSGRIIKLNNQMYLIDMTGRDRASAAGKAYGAGARQRLGWLMRVRTLDIGIKGALTTQDSTTLVGQAFVDGHNYIPDTWGSTLCDTTGDSTMAGIRYGTGGGINSKGIHVDGNPPGLKDPSVNGSTFTQFGDITYGELASMATKTLPPGNYKTFPVVDAKGLCEDSVSTNWGDGLNPSAACGPYWPIVHITGDVTLNGDQGQGILLVDGNLQLQGSFQYFGIVIIRGSLTTAGGGVSEAHFWGAVMAQSVDLSVNKLSGNATIDYSKCAITAALNNTGVVAPDRARGWTQLW